MDKKSLGMIHYLNLKQINMRRNCCVFSAFKHCPPLNHLTAHQTNLHTVGGLCCLFTVWNSFHQVHFQSKRNISPCGNLELWPWYRQDHGDIWVKSWDPNTHRQKYINSRQDCSFYSDQKVLHETMLQIRLTYYMWSFIVSQVKVTSRITNVPVWEEEEGTTKASSKLNFK